MKKYFFCFIGFIFYSCVSHQFIFQAFTHPNDLEKISIYSKPDKFYSYLSSDKEAGWIVKIMNKNANYFYVKLPPECYFSKKNIWVKSGDLGIIIQNYDSIKIPIYESSDTLSNSIQYIYSSTTGRIYDIKNDLFLLGFKYENKEILGWIEKKYLCGNPYTTCN